MTAPWHGGKYEIATTVHLTDRCSALCSNGLLFCPSKHSAG